MLYVFKKNLAKCGSSRKGKDILYKTYTVREMTFMDSLREIGDLSTEFTN